MTRLAWSAAVVGFLGLFGCEAMQTPTGYVRLDPPHDYAYRAVSADGAVLAVRTVDNPSGATLEFWSKAVRNELIESRGYKLDAEGKVTSGHGLPGIEMAMRTQVEGVDYLYLLTVFVKSTRVIIFEAGGPTATITPDLPAIRTAVRASPLL